MMPSKQTDIEINTLIQSFRDLEEAKQKFKESLDAIKVQRKLPNDNEILAPLTSSMYVPGRITDTNKYLVDVGTQYMVEKNADEAIDYFNRKIKFIDVQLGKFSQLLQARMPATAAASPSASTSSTTQ